MVTLRLEGVVPAAPLRYTQRAAGVAALFGLSLQQEQRTLFEPFDLELPAASITLITGPSGSGKSTLLRAIERGLGGQAVVRLDAIDLPRDVPVVDCFSCDLEEALGHLAKAGLSEAHILLRSPAELSEGQQFRYRLAQFFASDVRFLIADEFAATLDRVTAKLLSWQLRKFIDGSASRGDPRSAVLATTHDDLAADLSPDINIYKGLAAAMHLWQPTLDRRT